MTPILTSVPFSALWKEAELPAMSFAAQLMKLHTPRARELEVRNQTSHYHPGTH